MQERSGEVKYLHTLQHKWLDELQAKVMLLWAIMQARTMVPMEDSGVTVKTKTKGTKTTYHVHASDDADAIPARSIVMCITVRGLESFCTKAISTMAVKTETTFEAQGTKTLLITPYINLSAEEDQKFLPPFWMVRRSHKPEEVNMEITSVAVELQACYTPQGRDTKRSIDKIQVPVMTNTIHLPKGAELVLHQEEKVCELVVRPSGVFV